VPGNPDSIPVVDLRGADGAAIDPVEAAAHVGRALEERGFLYLRGHSLEPQVHEAFDMSRRFFAMDADVRHRTLYQGPDANFGYQGLEVESLDPSAAPDLKQTFTMRNAPGLPAADPRWPSAAFREQAVGFYTAALAQAHDVLGLIARALGLSAQHFTPLHGGENVTLRYLHYPAGRARSAGQLGAGEHTDYGAITLLFQDDVGGLEVRDASGHWIPAPPIPGCAVVNTGDLMERWTNGRLRSTPHRVRPVAGIRDRYSIALFVDPDSTVHIDCLPGCTGPGNPPRHPPVTAGVHLRQRIAATHR
jgi:isopenicillin N synthase-like dioxygenase